MTTQSFTRTSDAAPRRSGFRFRKEAARFAVVVAIFGALQPATFLAVGSSSGPGRNVARLSVIAVGRVRLGALIVAVVPSQLARRGAEQEIA